MAPRVTRIGFFGALAVIVAFAMTTASSGQNLASNKAFFASGANEVLVTAGNTKILEGDVKTSSTGDVMIGVSLECALWTGTVTNAPRGGGRQTSNSRAAVNLTVLVGGVEATPGQVVYCDREQEVSLTFNGDDAVILNDSITLELFLTTKNANHFNFYTRNPGNGVHHVEVWVNNVNSIADPNAPAGSTRAAIGKRTLVIEEFNSSN